MAFLELYYNLLKEMAQKLKTETPGKRVLGSNLHPQSARTLLLSSPRSNSFRKLPDSDPVVIVFTTMTRYVSFL